MPSQAISSIENNFTKGLITEATGLNFPENAATDTDNCAYTLTGDVTRRLGIDFETNFGVNLSLRDGLAITSYKWNNAGGDGQTQVMATQIGGTVYFYSITAATASTPLSTQLLSSNISLSTFTAGGATFDPSLECQFSDGNGYLFIFHANCDPIYCSYNAGVILGTALSLQIRDFTGAIDSLIDTARPTVLSPEHSYNLTNQGWVSGSAWIVTSTSTFNLQVTSTVFSETTVAGTPVIGSNVSLIQNHDGSGVFGFVPGGTFLGSGTVTAVVPGVSITVNVTNINTKYGGFILSDWYIVPTNIGYINTWLSAEGNYPSNSDVWWYFKNASGVFDPATTQPTVTLSAGRAPQGHYILSAFNQQRSIASATAGLTDITTTQRPKTGAWFQGRVWYSGVSASQQATGDAPFYTWSENIYFSQVNVGTSRNFAKCYQTNDPTSENLFDLLPTDGGVIQIQGAGEIKKLFPTQNGMLVFAANGVWFITGSQGIGFSANDYTITRISAVEALTASSFVDVLGLPYFWNEDSIYQVQVAQGGSLAVSSVTVGTIWTFYKAIPKSSKKYVKAAYDPINYTIQWIYRTTEEDSTHNRYVYDGILNYNTYNKAFYPYTVDTSVTSLNSINFVQGPGGSTSPDPGFKYFCSTPSGVAYNFTFADEHDETFVDWASSGTPINFTSFFITGFKLHGQGQKRFQTPLLYTFTRGGQPTSYFIQGIWDFGFVDNNSNRWTVKQRVNNNSPQFGMIYRSHVIRGNGLTLQFKITSVDGQFFDIMGWSAYENLNQGI